MEREHVNAITSLARTEDWQVLKGYLEETVRDIERSLGYADPTDSLGIARYQGARTALMNVINLEDTANQMNQPEVQS